MFLIFDPKTLIMNVRAGALEKYEPTEEITAICVRAEKLRKQADEKFAEIKRQMEEFIQTEIAPKAQEIASVVDSINKKNNPELEKLQKKAPQAPK